MLGVVSRLLAYIDDSGEKGLLRNLEASKDDEIALLAAIVIPEVSVESLRQVFSPPFESFKAARPHGSEKLHITDAFASNDANWIAVAGEVREAIFSLVDNHDISVIYEARRARIARESFEREQNLATSAAQERRSGIRLNDRPSTELLEEDPMLGLVLKLNAFCEDRHFNTVDLFTDQMDSKKEHRFKQSIEKAKSLSQPATQVVRGWNPETQAPVLRTIQFKLHYASGKTLEDRNAAHLGKLEVVGKDDPFVFAADVVANALRHHLAGLPQNAPINGPASIVTLRLGARVWGVRDGAIEDSI